MKKTNTAKAGFSLLLGLGLLFSACMPVSAEGSTDPAAEDDALPAYSLLLSNGDCSSDAKGAEIAGSSVTLTEAGEYTVKGSLTDGQITVNAGKESKVRLILDNVSISSSGPAAITVLSAERLTIATADGSENSLSASGAKTEIDGSKVDATIFSKDDLTLSGSGSLTVYSAQGHGIVSKDDLKVKSGTVSVSSARKGISANDTLEVEDGSVSIIAGTEGIEATDVVISGGELDISAQDDGINAAGADSSGNTGMTGGFFSPFEETGNTLTISGGTVRVNAEGDGLDANGDLVVTGGTLLINGPTGSGNGALDFTDGRISGGTVVAAGSAGMAMNFRAAENQCSLLHIFSAPLSAGTEIRLTDAEGKLLVSFTPEKTCQSVVISCPEFRLGESYTLSAGGETVEVTPDSMICGTGTGFMPGGMGGFGQGGFGHGGMDPFGHGGRGGMWGSEENRPEGSGSFPPEGSGSIPQEGGPVSGRGFGG